MLTDKYLSPKLALKLAKTSDFSLKPSVCTRGIQQLGFSLDPWAVEKCSYSLLYIDIIRDSEIKLQ
jgi:hypothetical protein